MVFASTSKEKLIDDLEAGSPDPDVQPGVPPPAKKSRLRFSSKLTPRIKYGLVFVVGLLVGWLAIGWWLWPVDWTNSTPWQLSPNYQRAYVMMVADNLWQTSDVAQAQKAVVGWKSADLLGLITTMQRETTDAEKRQHLVVLAEALQFPVTETSLFSSVMSQQVIVLGMFLALLPLLGAVAFVAAPLIRRRQGPVEELLTPEQQDESKLEELLADVQLEGAAGGQEPEKKEEEKKEEEKKEPQEESEEDKEAGLGDLASLFEDEDTSLSALEAFCKGLADITVDDLLATATELAAKLVDANAQLRKKS